ncbi:hypothetical protein FQR65_LT13901 [Abscondita terminalis]|nr:hypothetical protein FQR65_LT13901 [Abscondita terminalis]
MPVTMITKKYTDLQLSIDGLLRRNAVESKEAVNEEANQEDSDDGDKNNSFITDVSLTDESISSEDKCDN